MMKTFHLPSLPCRRALQGAAVLALAGLFAVLHGAPKSDSILNLKRDDKPVPRGQYDPASYADVVSKVSPSVVMIKVESKPRQQAMDNNPFPGLNDPFFRQFFGNRVPQIRQAPTEGLGSGVIVSADGYIVTNNHVVDGADTVTVTLSDGRELKARVVGRDPQTDIAVVKIDASGLPAVTFADSAGIRVGDRVLAVGNPFGIGETVTSGIVSATGRRVGLIDDGKGFENFIQTDAAINPGNSGGALVDLDGRLIGINTAILSHSGGFQGVGFAVPANMVSHVAESLVKTGKVVHGYLGINIQDISPALKDTFNLKDMHGALVGEVAPGSPASRAGIKDGDVVTALDGHEIKDANDLALAVSGTEPGTKVALDLIRDGKTLRLDATTGENPKARLASSVSNASPDDQGVLNGVGVDDLTSDTRAQFNIPEHLSGAIVTNVDPDSAAARAGISAGDVILSINRHAVSSAQDAVDLSSKPSSSGKTLVRLWSHGSTLYVVVDESHPDNSTS
jgi:serine protease Do